MGNRKSWFGRLIDSITGSGRTTSTSPETDRSPGQASREPTPNQADTTRMQLLGMFRRPNRADQVVARGGWGGLGEPPETAIQRMVDEGLLELSPVEVKLNKLKKVSDLKAMLKARNLPVSGKKAQLVKRLLDADREGVESELGGVRLLSCTERGEEAAERHNRAEQEAQEAFEKQVMDALRRREYAAASRLVAQFEAGRPVPRGIGVDWKNHDPSEDVFTLSVIMERTPRALAAAGDGEVEGVRAAAGMMYLMGVNRAAPWLSATADMDSLLRQTAMARTLVAHAQFAASIRGYKATGTKRAEILGYDDSCPACKKIQGKSYKLNRVPELPYAGCTREGGCRCTIIPVVD